MNVESLRALYPTLTDEKLKEAGENLRRYFECALHIANEANPTPVDNPERPPTIEERSLRSINNNSV
jgi:hypothetical protein